jgi:hypothetical protein
MALTTGVLGDRGHRVHVRFGNVFDDDGNIVIPSTYRLVVRSGYETSILINERDRVDGSQVLIICLDDLIRTQVVLLISLGPRIEEVYTPG